MALIVEVLQNKKLIFILYMIYRLFNIKLSFLFIYNYLIFNVDTYGDWGLGIGDWGLGIGPNPQSPIPNPQSPIPILNYDINKFNSKIFLK